MNLAACFLYHWLYTLDSTVEVRSLSLYVLAMNWFNGDELDGQGCWIGVGLAFEPVLYSYQPEIEVGLSQRSYKSAPAIASLEAGPTHWH
jgi:hypothetical protein